MSDQFYDDGLEDDDCWSDAHCECEDAPDVEYDPIQNLYFCTYCGGLR